MDYWVTACFYGGPQIAYPVVLQVNATTELRAVGVLAARTLEDLRTEFPEEIRDLICSAKDITVVNIERDDEKLLREQTEQEARDRTVPEEGVAPVEPEPKVKKKRLSRRK